MYINLYGVFLFAILFLKKCLDNGILNVNIVYASLLLC